MNTIVITVVQNKQNNSILSLHPYSLYPHAQFLVELIHLTTFADLLANLYRIIVMAFLLEQKLVVFDGPVVVKIAER